MTDEELARQAEYFEFKARTETQVALLRDDIKSLLPVREELGASRERLTAMQIDIGRGRDEIMRLQERFDGSLQALRSQIESAARQSAERFARIESRHMRTATIYATIQALAVAIAWLLTHGWIKFAGAVPLVLFHPAWRWPVW